MSFNKVQTNIFTGAKIYLKHRLKPWRTLYSSWQVPQGHRAETEFQPTGE